MSTVGISGFALELPPYRVALRDWCDWTGADADKTLAVVGKSFRMTGPQQNAYTLAAGAVLKLIDQYDLNPQDIGYLALGTESSTDNAAGAIVVKGMVDRALREQGRPPLSRYCEVPEVKHACLGAVYALKGALRWLALDGAGRKGIVIASDIAEYERGSTGEPTQGAGAVAMLVEEDPALLTIDLRRSTSASSYRHLDFRKPVARYQNPAYASDTVRHHDFPVFNGKYSNACYLDEVLTAVRAMLDRSETGAVTTLSAFESVFFHRPYHHLPRSALGLAWVAAVALDDTKAAELEALCGAAGVDLADVREELTAPPSGPFESALRGELAHDVYPNLQKLMRAFKKTPGYKDVIGRLERGAEGTMELGNLYTASLPAWLAAGLTEAAASDDELTGRQWLAVGYGSGDAAEVLPMQVAPRWREAAARIRFEDALEGAVDLDAAQYARLHDEGDLEQLPPLRRGFAISAVGERVGPEVWGCGRGELQLRRLA
jgi:hydroxymethylglutaryl-CoA synthase